MLEEDSVTKKHSLAGKSFFLVGNVFGYLTQSGAKELLEFLGATVVDRAQEDCYYALGDDEIKKLPSSVNTLQRPYTTLRSF